MRCLTAALALAALSPAPAIAQKGVVPAPAPAPVAATTAVTDGEVARCVVAISKLSSQASGVDQANINGVMLFFVGKLAARHPPAEVRTLIAAEGARAGKADTSATATECAREVTALGSVLQGR